MPTVTIEIHCTVVLSDPEFSCHTKVAKYLLKYLNDWANEIPSRETNLPPSL